MSICRRDFLRTGLAAAAATNWAHGWARASEADANEHKAEITGWTQVPAILDSIALPQFPDQDFVITDYGAVNDGETDCAAAIGNAISTCNQIGGGCVVIPAGQWQCNGPIQLLSNVNLYLEEGANITFGADPEDYLPVQLVRWQGIRCYNYSPFIYAYQQQNIAVTGLGAFYGQGAEVWSRWTDEQNPDWTLLQQMANSGVPVEERIFGSGHYLRPSMFEPYGCRNILVEGVTFADSPFWTMHPTFCDNVTIAGVTVVPGAKNDDGCDPDSCNNVLVEQCDFSTNDDNVSLKAGLLPDAQGLPGCENIVVRNCQCRRSTWSGLTIGSDAGGIIRNVFIENCTVNHCINAHFIKAWADGGGAIKDIYIRNNDVLACRNVFSVLPDAYDAPGTHGPPVIANLHMENVTCVESIDQPFIFTGDPRLPIDGVVLDNISIAKSEALKVCQIVNTTALTASHITLEGRLVDNEF